jgi:formylglycine-generating enzyme required for sulfatase activity
MEIEMKFAWIPPGGFLMGGDVNEDEQPVHRVTISQGFYMGIFPVTQAEWRAVMGYNPSQFPGDDRPVETVSWFDCQEFCEKMRGLTGKPVRLPTEAEWEYACRAGTTTEYSHGDGEDALKKVGWYYGNSNYQTHSVGKKKANQWGLFDNHGNVWEWCQDGPREYTAEDQTDPAGPSSKDDDRVVRGGCWGDPLESCRAACRESVAPAERDSFMGLRVCFRLD